MKRKVYAIVVIALLVAMVGLAGACTSTAAPAGPPATQLKDFKRTEVPNGFPAIQSWCDNGFRIFYAYLRSSDSSSNAGVSVTLSTERDVKCDG